MREAFIICGIQDFEADFRESLPQNPEFSNNPENFHQCA